jgi:hypothetical protein
MNKLSQAASLMGKIGGKHGTGKVKRRSKAHYKKMVEARRKKAVQFTDDGR